MSIYLTDTGETVNDDFPCIRKYQKYFTCEERANKWKIDQTFRPLCIDALIEALGYKKGEKIPSFLFKKLKEYEVASIGYEVLLATIKDERKNIQWAINNKEFKNEIGKISYIFAILSNHWKDSKKKMKIKEKRSKFSVPENINVGSGRGGSRHDISKFL